MAFSKQAVGLGIGVSGAALRQPVTGLPAFTFLRAANLCHTLQQLRVSSVELPLLVRWFFVTKPLSFTQRVLAQRQPSPHVVCLCALSHRTLCVVLEQAPYAQRRRC